MHTNSKTPKGPQQEPCPNNHARLLLEMYPKWQAERIAKQYIQHNAIGTAASRSGKARRLWAGVYWILNDLGPLPKGLA